MRADDLGNRAANRDLLAGVGLVIQDVVSGSAAATAVIAAEDSSVLGPAGQVSADRSGELSLDVRPAVELSECSPDRGCPR